MPHADPAGLIAARGGRVTRTRTAVLAVLFDAGRPISHDEVGEALDARGVSHDRVTLYRTLDWLVGHDLAHKVAGPDRAFAFMRDLENTSVNRRLDRHAPGRGCLAGEFKRAPRRCRFILCNFHLKSC